MTVTNSIASQRNPEGEAPHNAFPETRVRYEVLAFACTLSMITYIDRVCFGAAAPQLASELSLSGVADLKWAFTAFAIAYSVCEIPTGWLGDALGPRSTLIRIVGWWSICTAITGLVGVRLGAMTLGGLGTLIVVRFLFGAGEAGAYPTITRALHNWFPADEQSTAQGWVWMSGRLMGGLTPLFWMLLTVGTAWTPPLMNWRLAFVFFGLLGIAWCVAFAALFYNRPTEHPRVNAAECERIQRHKKDADESSHADVPWMAFLSSGNLWLLCGMYFCMAYGWYFNVTYLPSYLHDRYHLSNSSLLGAIYKGAPLWLGAIGCLVGGYGVDALIRRTGNRRLVRRWVGCTGLGLCAVCWLAAPLASNEHQFVLAISLAALCNDCTLASAWATCQDIGQRHAGVTAAWMNTVGTGGAAVAGWLTGTLLERAVDHAAWQLQTSAATLPEAVRTAAVLEGYNHNFLSYAVVYAVAAICWLVIDASKPIAQSGS